jgi:hypothetical protein
MIVRTLLLVLGVAEILAPRRFVDFWMTLAVEGSDAEVRDWVYTAARVEGLLIVLWVLGRSRTAEESAGETE